MTKYLDRDWLTLDAAVLRLGRAGVSAQPDDLLHMAAKGQLRVYARLRKAIAVCSVRVKIDKNFVPRRTINGRGSISSFVLLSRQDAWRLEAQGEAEVRYIRQREDDPLEPFEPVDPELNWQADAAFIVLKSEAVVLTSELDTLAASNIDEASEGQTDTHGREATGWPPHETELLAHLREATVRWWGLYDPADPSTAPINEKVVVWLVARGISQRTAEVMATILRADGLRSGPR